jgi:hypothetical protein
LRKARRKSDRRPDPILRVWSFYLGHRLQVNGARFSVDRHGTVRRRLKTRRDEWGHPVWTEVGKAKETEIRTLITRETGEVPITWRV